MAVRHKLSPKVSVADPEHVGASLEPALLSSVADPKHCDFNSEPALFSSVAEVKPDEADLF